jgi:aspartate aminotransferase
MLDGIRFRPAAEADFEALHDLSVRTLRPHLERIGRWDPERRRRNARRAFEAGSQRIVERDGAMIGCVGFCRHETHIEINGFFLEPAVQGQGLGSAILRALMAEAGGLPVHLEVLKQSPAARLYERAGFVRAAEQDYDWLYILPAPPETTRPMPALAERLKDVSVSPIVAMSSRARVLKAEGHDVISLAVGEPDFPTPPHAVEAAHQAALRGDTKYPAQDGGVPLKKAIQAKFRRENNLDYALDEICVCNGGKQVLMNALLATISPGDEVLIPVPYWASYGEMVKLAGGTPTFVNCPQNNGFKLRPEDLEAAITPRTKMLMLNFPNNPTGAACSREEMQAIADVMLRHPDIWVLTDDMYEHLVFDGFGFCTIAEVEPRLKDRVLTCNGVSKTYAMTGWRLGYAGGPKALIKAMVNMQGQVTSGVSTISQAAALAALEGPQDLVRERAEVYRARRDLVVELLNQAPGVTCAKPEGAFYVYPNIAGCLGKTSAGGRRIETDADFALALLEEKLVAAVHGGAYGMSPYLRISYATDTESLREACARIRDFCGGLA